jgi:hypothetical protein
MPSPNLQDGLPAQSYVSRPTSSHNRLVAASYHQTPPHNGSPQFNPPLDISMSAPITPANVATSWPSQRIDPQAPPAIPNYPDLRASIGSSLNSTPIGSSPGTDNSPGSGPVLDAATQAELSAKLAAEVARFEQKCREIPDTLSAADRQEALDKEKRGHATRKSQIRKKYGIQIRTSKLQPANFVRIPGQGDAPILAPISRIAAFRAPAASMTPMYAISTPSSVEQGRQRPIMVDPDPKRRKLENISPTEQNSSTQGRADPYGVPDGLQRRMSAQGETSSTAPEVLEVDELGKPEPQPVVSPQASIVKPVKKVQWEPIEPMPAQHPTIISTPTPPPSLSPQREKQPTPLADISNKSIKPEANEPKVKTDDKLVVITSEESNRNSGSEAEDSDFDPDEEIPARLPPGTVATRRSRQPTSSLSASPAPAPPAKPTVGRRKSSAASVFGSPKVSSTEENGGRRASLGRAARAARTVVQV